MRMKYLMCMKSKHIRNVKLGVRKPVIIIPDKLSEEKMRLWYNIKYTVCM